MTNAPDAIHVAVRDASAALGVGAVDYSQAVTRVREAIEGDLAYVRGILSTHAGRLLAAYRRANPETPDPLQAELFPGLPARLYVRPGEPVSPMECTRYGLEMARNMLFTRTANQVQGVTEAARRERDAFMELYNLVTPHMLDQRETVAQVLARIRKSGPGSAAAI